MGDQAVDRILDDLLRAIDTVPYDGPQPDLVRAAGQVLRQWNRTTDADSRGAVLFTLCGSLLLVTGGGRVAFRAEYTVGYASALACAVTWGAYSVLSRRLGSVVEKSTSGRSIFTAG